MSLFYLFKTAVLGLKTNKVRSALTILGIVIGITSIIMVMALGEGAKSLIVEQIQGMGARTISVEPGKEPESMADMFDAIYADSLREEDYNDIKKSSNVRGVERVSPMVITSTIVSYGNENKRGQVIGGDDFYLEILGIDGVTEGSMFREPEIKQVAKVVVIGSEISNDLFGFEDAIGKKVKIGNQSFRIMGVLPKSGTVMGMSVDKRVLVPYTTAQQYILGIKHYHAILVQTVSEDIVEETAEDIRLTLRENHDINDSSNDDFRVITMDWAMKQVGDLMTALTVLLAAVSAISLVVGGVGIMNIMLVSVSERTHEIGLRKAVGATSSDIMSQFLIESVILTAIGGAIGIGLGAGLSYFFTFAINTYTTMNWIFVFPVSGAMLGLAVSAGVGLVFGLYPARQAAKKSPIEALRYE